MLSVPPDVTRLSTLMRKSSTSPKQASQNKAKIPTSTSSMTTGKMESKTQSKLMQNAEKAKPGAEMERLLGRLDGELKAMEFGPKDKGIVKSAEALAGFKKGVASVPSGDKPHHKRMAWLAGCLGKLMGRTSTPKPSDPTTRNTPTEIKHLANPGLTKNSPRLWQLFWPASGRPPQCAPDLGRPRLERTSSEPDVTPSGKAVKCAEPIKEHQSHRRSNNDRPSGSTSCDWPRGLFQGNP
ncbi:hypothetical protein ABH930_004504 [Kitasatospora sp. GAS204A]|nr:hypothetical protein [Kitasatospora sp. GAS204B]